MNYQTAFGEAREDLLKLLATGMALEPALDRVCFRLHISGTEMIARLHAHGSLYLEARAAAIAAKSGTDEDLEEKRNRELNQVPQ